jgi:hypothetical protein
VLIRSRRLIIVLAALAILACVFAIASHRHPETAERGTAFSFHRIRATVLAEIPCAVDSGFPVWAATIFSDTDSIDRVPFIIAANDDTPRTYVYGVYDIFSNSFDTAASSFQLCRGVTASSDGNIWAFVDQDTRGCRLLVRTLSGSILIDSRIYGFYPSLAIIGNSLLVTFSDTTQPTSIPPLSVEELPYSSAIYSLSSDSGQPSALRLPTIMGHRPVAFLDSGHVLYNTCSGSGVAAQALSLSTFESREIRWSDLHSGFLRGRYHPSYLRLNDASANGSNSLVMIDSTEELLVERFNWPVVQNWSTHFFKYGPWEFWHIDHATDTPRQKSYFSVRGCIFRAIHKDKKQVYYDSSMAPTSFAFDVRRGRVYFLELDKNSRTWQLCYWQLPLADSNTNSSMRIGSLIPGREPYGPF